jgi:hypothetical protein
MAAATEETENDGVPAGMALESGEAVIVAHADDRTTSPIFSANKKLIGVTNEGFSSRVIVPQSKFLARRGHECHTLKCLGTQPALDQILY